MNRSPDPAAPGSTLVGIAVTICSTVTAIHYYLAGNVPAAVLAVAVMVVWVAVHRVRLRALRAEAALAAYKAKDAASAEFLADAMERHRASEERRAADRN